MRIASLYKSLACSVFAISLAATANAAELKIVGTGDGLEMLRALAVAYAAEHDNVEISIPPSIGSGGGVVAVGSDRERLGRVARPLKPSEVKYGLVYVPIAKIPSAIFTHPSTNIKGLTSSDLVRVYSGKATSWSDLGGAQLKVKVVRREEADSTLQVLRASMPGWSSLEFTSRSKTAVTTQDAIQTVRKIPGTIGFGPYSKPLGFDMNVLRIDGKFPTDPDYPSAVELALIYKVDRLDSDMKSFVDFSLSEAGAKIITNYGGVPVRQ